MSLLRSIGPVCDSDASSFLGHTPGRFSWGIPARVAGLRRTVGPVAFAPGSVAPLRIARQVRGRCVAAKCVAQGSKKPAACRRDSFTARTCYPDRPNAPTCRADRRCLL